VLVAVWADGAWHYADPTLDVPFDTARAHLRERFARVPRIPDPVTLPAPEAVKTTALAALPEHEPVSSAEFRLFKWVAIGAAGIALIALLYATRPRIADEEDEE
jgi:hypothetical protein